MLSILQRTRSSAEALACKVAPYATTVASTSLVIPPLTNLALPLPRSLAPELLALGVDGISADRIACVVQKAALRLKTSLEEDYNRRRRHVEARSRHLQDSKIPVLVTSVYISLFNMAMQQWRQYILDKLTPRVLRVLAANHVDEHVNIHAKKAFNQSAIPILEKFFEDNAFPSRLEKHELASECQLSYTQIRVWFQNRRSRYRKEGKELKKRDAPATFLDELQSAVVDTLLPPHPAEDDAADDVDHSDSPFPSQTKSCDLNPASPLHAFPSQYPPSCSYEPFPDEGKRCLSLPWIRTASRAGSPSTSTTTVDVCELSSKFAEMALVDHPAGYEDNHVLAPIRRFTRHPAQSPLGFITPCSRAPIPALIRKPKWSMRRSESFVRPRSCRRDVAQTARPHRGDGMTPRPTAQPFSHPNDTAAGLPSSSPRKKCSLPRRIPRNPPASHGQDEPPKPRPLFPPSRLASVSSCGTGSDTDSPLNTPVTLMPSLPFDLDLSPESSGGSLKIDFLSSLHPLSWDPSDLVTMNEGFVLDSSNQLDLVMPIFASR